MQNALQCSKMCSVYMLMLRSVMPLSVDGQTRKLASLRYTYKLQPNFLTTIRARGAFQFYLSTQIARTFRLVGRGRMTFPVDSNLTSAGGPFGFPISCRSSPPRGTDAGFDSVSAPLPRESFCRNHCLRQEAPHSSVQDISLSGFRRLLL